MPIHKPRPTSQARPRWLFGRRGKVSWVMYYRPRHRGNLLVTFDPGPNPCLANDQLALRRFEVAKRVSMDPASQPNGGLGPAMGELSAHAPNLLSWLCDVTYEDGSVKGRTQLQMERKGDRMRVLLKSADGGLLVEAFHEDATSALLTLELLLGSDDCPWQLDPFPFQGPKKGRKK